MRSTPLRLAITSTLVLFGCQGSDGYEWGIPYEPTAGGDEDDDDAPPEDEDAPPEDDSESDATPPPEDDSVGETDSGPVDPTMPLDETGGGESTGEAIDTADTGESPYQGGWDIGSCQEMQSADVADFQLTDQFGDTVRLYDFCHKAVLITAGSFW